GGFRGIDKTSGARDFENGPEIVVMSSDEVLHPRRSPWQQWGQYVVDSFQPAWPPDRQIQPFEHLVVRAMWLELKRKKIARCPNVLCNTLVNLLPKRTFT